MVHRVAAAVAGGVDMVQLREKDLPGGSLLELAGEIKAAVAGRALLLVNERVDVALAVGASGVQLGEEALPTARSVTSLVYVWSPTGRWAAQKTWSTGLPPP